jgi:hypothetical protein
MALTVQRSVHNPQRLLMCPPSGRGRAATAAAAPHAGRSQDPDPDN